MEWKFSATQHSLYESPHHNCIYNFVSLHTRHFSPACDFAENLQYIQILCRRKIRKKITHKLQSNLKAHANAQRHPLIWKIECLSEKGCTLGIDGLNRPERSCSYASVRVKKGARWAACVQRPNAFTLLLLTFLKHVLSVYSDAYGSNDPAAPNLLWTLNT